MVDVQSWAAVLFIILIAGFLILRRKKVEIQSLLFPLLYFALYRTSWGLRAMDRMAKRLPRLTNFLGRLGVVIGFLGMAFISFEVIRSSIALFVKAEAPGIMPVLPVEAKGVFFVPFFYWIVSIFVIAVV